MKKILLTLMCLFMLSSIGFAQSMAEKVAANLSYTGETKRVSVLLDAPVSYADNEEIRNMVVDKTEELFPTPKFLLNPFEEGQMMKKIYREEHGMATDPQNMIYDFGPKLRMADIQAIGQSLNADYLVFIQVSNSEPQYSSSSSFIPFIGGVSSSKVKATITCDIRIMDVKAGKYVTMKEVVKEGKSSSTNVGGIGSGGPSFSKAYMEAIERCLYEVDIDTSAL